MINNSEEKKQMIFKLWDTLGVTWENTKYVSERFHTFEDYYKTLAEYYGVNGASGLKELMINDSNEILSLSNVCSGGTIRMYNIGLEERMTSVSKMYGMYDKGIGGSPFSYFAYSEDPNFECNDDEAKEYGDCYDVYCLMPPIKKVNEMLKKKYGIYTNTEVNDEKYMRGNIKISSK